VTAAQWIARLDLRPHPEGGYYRQTYRSDELVTHLPPRFSGARPMATSIYFLLQAPEVSRLHRIKSDEIWHAHAGSTLLISEIDGDGTLIEHRLGTGPEDAPQAVIRAGHWFGARLLSAPAWMLAGCTVAPGFDFADLELAERAALITRYPHHRRLIESLTG
jgi:predicted cupin superfamily sugar epimerase